MITLRRQAAKIGRDAPPARPSVCCLAPIRTTGAIPVREIAAALLAQLVNVQRLAAFAARQKFRLDLGGSFFQLINFTFICITASDKLAAITGLRPLVVVLLSVPCVLFVVWAFGTALDRAGYARHYTEEQNRNNPTLRTIAESVSQRNP